MLRLRNPFLNLFYNIHKLNEYYHFKKKGRTFKELFKIAPERLYRPLVGGYSDIFIIADSSFDKFAHYCGLYSATHLFVEIAIPTALVMSSSEIIEEKDLDKRGITFWENDEKAEFENKYNRSMKQLLHNFPSDGLYIHPVKLSRWID